jgi:hypothetical protein
VALPPSKIPDRFHVHEDEPVVDPASRAAGVAALEDRIFHPPPLLVHQQQPGDPAAADLHSYQPHGDGALDRGNYVRRVFPSSNPVSRREVAHLQLTLQDMLRELNDPGIGGGGGGGGGGGDDDVREQLATTPGAAARACLGAADAEQAVLSTVFDECARQVSAHCYERGETLRAVWERSQHLYRLLPLVIADLQAQLADERDYSDALRDRLSNYLDAAQDESAAREARLAAHVRHLEAHLDAQEDEVVRMRDALQREQDSDPARVISRQRRVIAALQEAAANAAGGESALEERIEELKSEIQHHEIVAEGMVKRLTETRTALLETRKLLIRTDFDGERFYDKPLSAAARGPLHSPERAAGGGGSAPTASESPRARASTQISTPGRGGGGVGAGGGIGGIGAGGGGPSAAARTSSSSTPGRARAESSAADLPVRTSSFTGAALRSAPRPLTSQGSAASLVTGLPMTSPSAPPLRTMSGRSQVSVDAADNAGGNFHSSPGRRETTDGGGVRASQQHAQQQHAHPAGRQPSDAAGRAVSTAATALASREELEAEEIYLAARARSERERYDLTTEIVQRLTDIEVARLEERKRIRAAGGDAKPMLVCADSERTALLLRHQNQSTWEQRWDVEKRLLQTEVLRLREDAQRGAARRRGIVDLLTQPISKRCAQLDKFDAFAGIISGETERKIQPRGWLLALIDQVYTARFIDMRLRDETRDEHPPFPEFVFQFLVSDMPDLAAVRFAVFDILIALGEYRGGDYWINTFGLLLEEEIPLPVHRQLLQVLATSQDVLGVGVQYPNTPLRQHPFWVDTDRALRVVEVVRPDLDPEVREDLRANVVRFSTEAPHAEITLLLASDAAHTARYQRVEFDVFVELVVKHLMTDHDRALIVHRDAFIKAAHPGRHLVPEAVRFFFQAIDPTLREREVIGIFAGELSRQVLLPESIGEPEASSGLSWRSVARVLNARDMVTRRYAHLYTAPVHLLSREERISVYATLEDQYKNLQDILDQQIMLLRHSNMWDKVPMAAHVIMLRDRFDRELSLSTNPLRALYSYRKLLDAVNENQLELQHASGEIAIKYLPNEFQLAQSNLRQRQAFGTRRGFTFDPTENPIFAVIRRVRAIVWIQRAFKKRLAVIREAKSKRLNNKLRDGANTIRSIVAERQLPLLGQVAQSAKRAKRNRRRGITTTGASSAAGSGSGSSNSSSPAGSAASSPGSSWPRRERSGTTVAAAPSTPRARGSGKTGGSKLVCGGVEKKNHKVFHSRIEFSGRSCCN